MTFRESIEKRYTTKQYDPSKKLSEDVIEDLKSILHLSPSSINSQPWKFLFIRDPEMKKKLSEVSWVNTQKILDADTLVVFNRVESIAFFEKQIEEELPEGAVNYFKEFIKPLPEEEIKAWFDRQVYLALGMFLSACAAMGVDATPMEGIEPDNYDKILGNDTHHTIVAVAIGHRDPEDFNQPSKKPKSRININKIIKTI